MPLLASTSPENSYHSFFVDVISVWHPFKTFIKIFDFFEQITFDKKTERL